MPCSSQASASASHSSQETPSWPSTISAMRTRLAGGRRAPLLGGDLFDVRRERPAMTLGILRAVGAVTVEHILGLVRDLCPGRLGALEMRIDVVDVDVDLRAGVAATFRALEVLAGAAHHDPTVAADPHLRVVDGAAVLIAERLLEPERLAQEHQCAGAVLVEQVRRDPLHFRGS